MTAEPRRPASSLCPICGRPARAESRPFCSARCADVDLGRWFGEQYRVPSVNDPDQDPTEYGDGRA